MLKKKNIWLFTIYILFLLITAGMIVFCKTETKTVNKINSDSQKDLGLVEFANQKYRYNREIFNILFLGIDNDTKMLKQDIPSQAGQADTILVISFNRKTNETFVTQIPRDTMTEVDLYNGYGNRYDSKEMQLALQYAYNIGGESSCWAMKKKVAELLCDLPIDGYIAFDIAGLPIINDRIGGVTITCVRDYSHINPLLQKGETVILNGEQAEQFVRYRDVKQSFSNKERMERQVEYIEALLESMRKELGANPDYYNILYPFIEEYMLTDLREDQINVLTGYINDSFTVQYLPGEWVSGKIYDEFHIDKEELMKLMIETFYVAES